jgi:uncharacterized membrane protein YhiD involved in acid resistance
MMKKTLLSILLIFIISIVGCNSQQTPTKEKSSISQKELYDLQEKCRKQSEDWVEKKYKGKKYSYNNHYNNKLNKCFILVFEKQLGYLVVFNDRGGVFIGYILGKKCETEEEWDKFVKPYMEE